MKEEQHEHLDGRCEQFAVWDVDLKPDHYRLWAE